MNLWKRLVLKLRGTKENVDVNSTPSQPISDSPDKNNVGINSTPSYKISDSLDFEIDGVPITTIPKIGATKDWQSEVVPHERVVVLFFAIWSQTDKMLTQALTQLLPEFEHIKFLSVDVDEIVDEADKTIVTLVHSWEIYTVPTLVLLKYGEQAATTVGYRGEEQLRTILKDWSAL